MQRFLAPLVIFSLLLWLFLDNKDLHCNCWDFCFRLWVQTVPHTKFDARSIAEVWELSQIALMGSLHRLETSNRLVSVQKKAAACFFFLPSDASEFNF